MIRNVPKVGVVLAAGGNLVRKPRVAPDLTLRVEARSWIPACGEGDGPQDMYLVNQSVFWLDYAKI